jgi:hypothetical protein
MADEASVILGDVLAILRGLKRWQPTAVTDGDYGVVDDGKQECAVLWSGRFDQDGDAQNREMWTYSIMIDLFEKDNQDGKSWANFRELRGVVLEELRKYPQLNDDTIFVSAYDLSAEDDPERIARKSSNVIYIAETIRANYTIAITVAGGDYA